jgi:diamine N-acetyltransferase
MNFLENEIIKLRAIEPSDIDLLYEWENDTEVWEVSNTLVPFSRFILQKYIDNAHLDIYESKQLRLMIDLKQLNKQTVLPTIGMIDLFDYDPYHQRAGVGILIYTKEERRKSYASESIRLLIQYCFKYLKFHQLYCNIAVSNDASLTLFTKLGFQLIGEKKEWLKKTGGWTGEYLLQLLNTEN